MDELKLYTDKEWEKFSREEKNEMTMNFDRYVQGKVHNFPICPTLVDTTTGARYKDLDRGTLGDFLKFYVEVHSSERV